MITYTHYEISWYRKIGGIVSQDRYSMEETDEVAYPTRKAAEEAAAKHLEHLRSTGYPSWAYEVHGNPRRPF